MESKAIIAKLKERFGDVVEPVEGVGDPFAVVKEKSRLLEICRYLKETPELAFDYPACVCGVDDKTTLWTVYHLYSIKENHSVVLKVNVGREQPVVTSVTPVWRGADWHERETFDMYGIRFDGHPNLKRILLPDDWEGYPLRKDYEFPDMYRDIPLR